MDIKELLQEIETKEPKEALTIFKNNIIDYTNQLKEHCPQKYNEIIEKMYIELYGEHFNEKMAKKAVENMIFVIENYDFKYSPEQIEQLIEQTYKQTNQIMSKYGKIANPIPEEINKWDKYYTFNMICADYPLSHNGDSNKIALMTYEFLSDPDAPICKPYKYYKAMKTKDS